VILVYDVKTERVNKVNKYLRQYLYWRQNSVFEGEINKNTFNRLLTGLKKHLDLNADSVLIYTIPEKKRINSILIGVEKGRMDTVL